MKFISSRDNPGFKRLRALLDDARMRRTERASIIDGEHLLQAALDADWPIRQLLLREDVLESAVVADVLQRLKNVDPELPVLVMAPALFNALSPVLTPTGMLAEIALPSVLAEDSGAGDVLALAGVQDAGNLGSLLRTAVAAGVTRVWLDAQTTQAWSPKALRAGMGAQFCLAIEEGCDLLPRLTGSSRPVLVTSLGPASVSLYALDLRQPNIWVFGAEGQGVPAVLQALAQHRVRIPMPGKIESLNVGAAAAVCLFEQVRQREVAA
ncbi:RNA methyltransferase [Uliginosibacterium flavum]|uniref:RNA methyltransferase n=1 Tax=Uliginosibacterium flavum TaxID=1396831 RepID=A0ABV2TN58_9RHOO